ncbi:hypothetical protein BN59_02047 [Legionella massiliensis]|uniref:Uncharacterized protein n=1 Tax=Legionella massiliensis TaxID=1034943 RepID=A0A078KXI9_9GAMM|nr:hypothetical protein [Legionella massiliensis]CDZ77757.1 hypothetical protein BN59_02047 [Legionella massiliensis]CEE13495.1 hypothetical protein BN1094_02047 [Legionella massiliensis]
MAKTKRKRSATEIISGALYFTSSVFYLSGAYGDFISNNITTPQIIAGALMVTGNLVWMSASIFDICAGCIQYHKKDPDDNDESRESITPEEDLELQKTNLAGSTKNITSLLNINETRLKRSPSGDHLSLEFDVTDMDDEPKNGYVVVLNDVRLRKKMKPEDSPDELKSVSYQ